MSKVLCKIIYLKKRFCLIEAKQAAQEPHFVNFGVVISNIVVKIGTCPGGIIS